MSERSLRPLPWIALALSLALAPVARGADGVIAGIRIEGHAKVEEAAIRDIIDVEAGDLFRAEAIRQAIRDIHRLGHFRDIEVYASRDAGGVVLTFVVVEKPSIREVIFQGNDNVQIDDITEVVTLQPFTILDEAKVVANAQRVEGVYLDKGYYLVEVDTELQELDGNEVNVVFQIEENKKVLVKQIDIVGNAAFPDSRLKMFMQTKEAGIFPGAGKAGRYRDDLLADDVEQLTAIYVEFGYLEVRLGTPEVTLSPDKRWVFITIPVEEGEPYSIGEVSIDGDIIFPEDELYDLISVRAGEPWRRGRIMEDSQALTDRYADDGYAFVHVVPLPATDPVRRVADIRYVIHKGNRVTLDRIRITGNTTTWDKVIRREIGIDEGEPWRGSELARARYRLERLGYFEDVRITTPRGEQPDTLDLVVDVTEKPTGSFNVGAGYSSSESFTFTGNFSRDNFLGLGWSFRAAANVSLGTQLADGVLFGDNSRQQIQADLFDPYFLDTRFSLHLAAYSRVIDYGLREANQGFSVGLGRYLGRNDDVRVNLEYALENRELTSLPESQRNFLGGQFYRGGFSSSLTASAIVDRRNNRIAPTRGFYASAAAELAGGVRTGGAEVVDLLGGDVRLLRLQANVRGYLPLFAEQLVLRANLSAGHVRSLDGAVVPYTHRYRAGGIHSLRGFEPYSVGPYHRWLANDDPVHASDGVVLGGTSSVIANLELEFPIVPPAGVRGVVFFDAGAAFGGLHGDDPLRPSDIRTSAGFGLRWNSPMGLLRFEWGFPLRPRPGEREMVFEFTMGGNF